MNNHKNAVTNRFRWIGLITAVVAGGIFALWSVRRPVPIVSDQAQNQSAHNYEVSANVSAVTSANDLATDQGSPAADPSAVDKINAIISSNNLHYADLFALLNLNLDQASILNEKLLEREVAIQVAITADKPLAKRVNAGARYSLTSGGTVQMWVGSFAPTDFPTYQAHVAAAVVPVDAEIGKVLNATQNAAYQNYQVTQDARAVVDLFVKVLNRDDPEVKPLDANQRDKLIAAIHTANPVIYTYQPMSTDGVLAEAKSFLDSGQITVLAQVFDYKADIAKAVGDAVGTGKSN